MLKHKSFEGISLKWGKCELCLIVHSDVWFCPQVEYSLVPQDGSGGSLGSEDAFRIDPKSGVITTRTLLDREQVEVFTLVVMATDQGLPSAGGQQSSTCTVVVHVIDDNDNYPQFTERTYTVQVPEDINWNKNPVIAAVK